MRDRDEQIPANARLAQLRLDQIRVDGNTNPRESLSTETVAEYAVHYRSARELPALVVFHDGSNYWLVSGFHRHRGAQQAALACLPCWVIPGTVEDAQVYAASTNLGHGLKRTPGDKRRAVHLVLQSPRAKDWPPERIAAHCDVSLGLVRAIKQSTPWTPPAGLFGPDELATPPAPDRANVTAEPEAAEDSALDPGQPELAASDDDEDRRKLELRACRTVGKLVRFANELGTTPVALVERYREKYTPEGEAICVRSVGH